MKLFRRFSHKSDPSAELITLTRKDLENAIVSAHMKIKAVEENAAKEKIKKDDLADSLKQIIGSFCIIVLCLSAAFAIYSGYKIYIGESLLFYGFIIIAAVIYCAYSILILRAVNKETDRSFLVGYMSALTALAALIVAFAALYKA